MKGRNIEILLLALVSTTLWDMLRQMNIFSPVVHRVLWILSIFIFVFMVISVLKDFHFESNYYKSVLLLFLSYQLVTVIRGFFSSHDNLIQIFKEPINFFAFIVPLFVFIDKNRYTISSLVRVLYGFGILFLIISLCFPGLLLTRIYASTIISTLALGCGFLLMNANYLSNRKTNISFFVVILSLLFLIYLARRSHAFTYIAIIFSSYLLNKLNKSNKIIFKFFPLIITIGMFLIIFPNGFSTKLTKRLSERLFEDSRSVLFAAFFEEMDDFKIFGKGMNGTYYFPIGEWEVEEGVILTDDINRNVIENGYLQLYLTGGLVNVILHVLLLLPAAILGVFKSNNQFTMACGVLIFLRLLDMLFFGLPSFSLHYIIIWICVGICYKKNFRFKTNSQIKDEFFYGKYIENKKVNFDYSN